MLMAQLPDSQKDVMEESSWSSANKLSRKVRELAQRSYDALKARGGGGLAPEQDAEELRDLRDQVARLQGKIHARRLLPLFPWIDTLRCRLEERLKRAEQRGPMQ